MDRSGHNIRVGIDASSIGVAGGATHLVEILKSLHPRQNGIKKVTLWGAKNLLDRIEPRNWLHLRNPSLLEQSLLHRLYWQQYRLTGLAEECCDVLFVPGGLYLGQFRPFVTMMRNMLPFDLKERARYGWTSDYVSDRVIEWKQRLRLHLLEFAQRKTFERSDGVIFLSRSSRNKLKKRFGRLEYKHTIIPHGISDRFNTDGYEGSVGNGAGGDFKWLYVSPVRLYKHQWNVVRAIGDLRKKGYEAELILAGHSNKSAIRKLRDVAQKVDSGEKFIHYHGQVPHSQIVDLYQRADGFVFASTCETFGQVLTEAMQAGLPIACSNRSAAPEIVQEAGQFFDPEQPEEIAESMRKLMEDEELREKKVKRGYERVGNFSWVRCARETFSFISKVTGEHY